MHSRCACVNPPHHDKLDEPDRRRFRSSPSPSHSPAPQAATAAFSKLQLSRRVLSSRPRCCWFELLLPSHFGHCSTNARAGLWLWLTELDPLVPAGDGGDAFCSLGVLSPRAAAGAVRRHWCCVEGLLRCLGVALVLSTTPCSATVAAAAAAASSSSTSLLSGREGESSSALHISSYARNVGSLRSGSRHTAHESEQLRGPKVMQVTEGPASRRFLIGRGRVQPELSCTKTSCLRAGPPCLRRHRASRENV